MMEQIELSMRLQAVADMVTPGNRVCDVGCDHGFVSIYLVEQQISNHVIAMDVRSGPLERAIQHVKEQQLEEYITCRLSDGITALNAGEADTMICAGMGGRLMIHILEKEKEKTDSFQELILQPQSEPEKVRRYVRENGFIIVEESMVYEEGKYYPMFRAVHNQGQMQEATQIEDRYGALLLQEKNPVLLAFLEYERQMYHTILEELMSSKEPTQRQLQRMNEVRDELQRNEHIRSKYYAL